MGILDESTSISNFIILTSAVSYLIHKFINKKYGVKFKSNVELLDYALDVLLDKLILGTDKALVATPKWMTLKEKIWKKKTVDEIDKVSTIPKTDSISKSKVVKPEKLEDSLMRQILTKMEEQIAEIDSRSGMAISSFQLELNHLVNKLQKVIPNLNYNNGENTNEEENVDDSITLTPEEEALIAEDVDET